MRNNARTGGLELAEKNGGIWLRDIDLRDVLNRSGTPAYIYDLDSVKERISSVKKAVGPDISLYYAVKANPSPGILKRALGLVDGLDVSSSGEAKLALAAGFPAGSISFAGPGKTDEELEFAVVNGVGCVSVESVNELSRLDRIAAERGRRVNIAARINPLTPAAGLGLNMAGKPSQFGIDEDQCEDFISRLKSTRNCALTGIHVYSGTQCLYEKNLIDNAARVLVIAEKFVKEYSAGIKTVNFGGGFGVPYYEGQKELDIDSVCSGIRKNFDLFRERSGIGSCKGILELGRYLTAQSGIYACRVIDVKRSHGRIFCVLDGGINHNLQAAGLFGKFLRENIRIINISGPGGVETGNVTFAGPLCTSIDIMGADVEISLPSPGQYIGFLTSGAYAYSASPVLFLSREAPREIFIEDNKVVDMSLNDRGLK